MEEVLAEHPPLADLQALLREDLPEDRRGRVLLHLLLRCPTCCAAVAPDVLVFLGIQPADPESYGKVIRKAFRKVRDHVKREDEKARKGIATLEKEGLDAFAGRFRGSGAYFALLERSRSLRHENPREMVRLAHHATLAARALDPSFYGAPLVADFQCRAWAELGNAHRVAENFPEAEDAFRRAAVFFLDGSRDEFLEAVLLDRQASFYGDKRQFGMAFVAFDTAHALYLRHGETHLAGRTLIKKGVYTGYKGDAEEAIRLTREGLDLIDKKQDPTLLYVGIHNLARWLMDAGRLREAKAELTRNRWRRGEAGGRLNLLKLRWLEGQIYAGLGELEPAEQAYLEVKEGFTEAGKPYDTAVVLLDLAALWLRQDRALEAKQVALQSVDLFLLFKIHREALGAILILTKAFQMNTATVNLVEEVATYMRRARNDPKALFDPPQE